MTNRHLNSLLIVIFSVILANAAIAGTAIFDFEGSLDGISTTGEQVTPVDSTNVDFVMDAQGQAVKLRDGVFLTYPTENLISEQAGTVMLWVKTAEKWNQAGRTEPLFLFQAGNQHWTANTISLMVEPDGKWLYTISDSKGNRKFTQPTCTWKAGETYCIAFTWSANSMKLYENGKQIGSNTAPSLPSDLKDKFYLGASFHNANWSGNIDLHKALVSTRELDQQTIQSIIQQEEFLGEIKGTITDGALPVSGALVTYVAPNDRASFTFTDLNGEFKFSRLKSEVAEISVYYPGKELLRTDIDFLLGQTNQIPALSLTPSSQQKPAEAVTSGEIAKGPMTLSLSWEAPAADDIGLFLIYRGISQEFPLEMNQVVGFVLPEADTAVPGKRYHFTDHNFNEIIPYYYAIVAVDSSGNLSAPYWLISQPLNPLPPEDPQIDNGSFLIDTKPVLSWLPVEADVTYRVELSETNDFQQIKYVFENIASTVSDGRIIYTMPAPPDGKWWWRVCAVFPSGIMSQFAVADAPFEYVDTTSSFLVPYVAVTPQAIHPKQGVEKVTINYVVARTAFVTINIFNLKGELVKQIMNKELVNAEGNLLSTEWDGTNQGGRLVANGLYFIQFSAQLENEKQDKKLVRRVGVFR